MPDGSAVSTHGPGKSFLPKFINGVDEIKMVKADGGSPESLMQPGCLTLQRHFIKNVQGKNVPTSSGGSTGK